MGAGLEGPTPNVMGLRGLGKNCSFPITLGWVCSSQHPAHLHQAERSEVCSFRPILSFDLDKSEHLLNNIKNVIVGGPPSPALLSSAAASG